MDLEDSNSEGVDQEIEQIVNKNQGSSSNRFEPHNYDRMMRESQLDHRDDDESQVYEGEEIEEGNTPIHPDLIAAA
jgi:hypothetical protein